MTEEMYVIEDSGYNYRLLIFILPLPVLCPCS